MTQGFQKSALLHVKLCLNCRVAMQSWTFGILCYNELESLPGVVDATLTLAKSWDLPDYEILLVDDGSTDGTRSLILELGRKTDRIRHIFHKVNMGIGAGIRSIYFGAQYENVVFIPGDGQFDVNELKAYRDFPASTYLAFYRTENLTYSAFRNSLTWCNKAFNRIFLGMTLRDVNWVKVYKREIIIALDLRIFSSAIESEICAKLALSGIKPIEIESRYLPRIYGQSKGASWASIYRVVRELIKLFLVVLVFRLKKKS